MMDRATTTGASLGWASRLALGAVLAAGGAQLTGCQDGKSEAETRGVIARPIRVRDAAARETGEEPEELTLRMELAMVPRVIPTDAAEDDGWSSSFVGVADGLRVGIARRMVEVDAFVNPAIGLLDGETLYIKQILATHDSEDRRAILLTEVLPSDLHEGLLTSGLDHGEPGLINQYVDEQGIGVTQRIAATGEAVRVSVVFNDPETGRLRSADPMDWVVHETTGQRFASRGLVFAGSNVRLVEGNELYDADLSGTVIGLLTLGTEVIGLDRTISIHGEIDDPVWVIDFGALPPPGWPVRIRIEGL